VIPNSTWAPRESIVRTSFLLNVLVFGVMLLAAWLDRRFPLNVKVIKNPVASVQISQESVQK